MTKDEIQAFNEMMLKIIKSDKRKMVPIGEDEYLAMVPIGEVFAHLRAFTNFIKSKDVKK